MTILTESEVRALCEALEDEYRAWATYDQAVADFGDSPPFSNIRASEARHIEALRTLFVRYGLSVPENPWPGKVGRFPSRQAACAAAVAAEVENSAMYGRLLLAGAVEAGMATVEEVKRESVQYRWIGVPCLVSMVSAMPSWSSSSLRWN